MISTTFNLYWVMYVYIEEYLQDNFTDSEEQFLSDGNPFIWENQTWDPSIIDNFNKLFDTVGTYDSNGFKFILSYLNNLNEIYFDVKKLSCELDETNYVEATNIINENGFEYYFKKYGLKK